MLWDYNETPYSTALFNSNIYSTRLYNDNEMYSPIIGNLTNYSTPLYQL